MNIYKDAIFELDGLATLLSAAVRNLSIVHESIEEEATKSNTDALFAVYMFLDDIEDQIRTIINRSIKEGRCG